MNDWKDVPPAPRTMKEDESPKEIRQGGVIPQQRPLQCENIKLLTPPKKKVESENPMNEWKDVLRAKKEDESLEEISQGGVLPQQRSPQRENNSILPPPEEKIETVNPVTDLNIVSLAPRQKIDAEAPEEVRQGGILPPQRPKQYENVKKLTPPTEKAES